jgi:hypothetical protein
VVAANRASLEEADNLRVGWKAILPDDRVVMFLDCSKSDDSTALMGCRVDDSFVFTLGVWAKPKGERGERWLVPRGQVDSRVTEAFDRFNVVGFFADPSHAIDDEDGSRYWDGLIDDWHRRYKDRLLVWSRRSGHNTHAVMFDMTSPERHKTFVEAAETWVEDMEALNDIEEYAPTFQIDGNPAFISHLQNARRFPTKDGDSLMKDNRESARKIDMAVAAVGARMLRRIFLNTEQEEESRSGEVWGMWDQNLSKSEVSAIANQTAMEDRAARRLAELEELSKRPTSGVVHV